jgi:uncharacterized membrane protein
MVSPSKNTTLEDLLMVEMSRRNTDLVADLIMRKQDLFAQLMKVFLRDEEPVSRRAAWVIDNVSERYPELIKPYLSNLAERLSTFNHGGMKRHSLRILARSPLPDEHLGTLINLCFDWLTSAREAVAAKIFCMEILYRIAQTEPDLRKELADSIEWRMQEETPGFRNKGAKLLKKIYKEMKTSIYIALFLFSGLFIPKAGAQIIIKNGTPEPIYLATARYISAGQSGYWQTQGWWTIKAGGFHEAFEILGERDSIGYWCMNTLSETVFAGKKELLVNNDEKFTIRQADKPVILDQHPEYVWRKFRIMRMKPGTTVGTITVKE